MSETIEIDKTVLCVTKERRRRRRSEAQKNNNSNKKAHQNQNNRHGWMDTCMDSWIDAWKVKTNNARNMNMRFALLHCFLCFRWFPHLHFGCSLPLTDFQILLMSETIAMDKTVLCVTKEKRRRRSESQKNKTKQNNRKRRKSDKAKKIKLSLYLIVRWNRVSLQQMSWTKMCWGQQKKKRRTRQKTVRARVCETRGKGVPMTHGTVWNNWAGQKCDVRTILSLCIYISWLCTCLQQLVFKLIRGTPTAFWNNWDGQQCVLRTKRRGRGD